MTFRNNGDVKMTAKHTPGPWEVQHSRQRNPHAYRIYSVTERAAQTGVGPHHYQPCICEGAMWLDSDPADESLANAHLIAAAPELLAALREYLAADDALRNGTPENAERYRKAIAQACAAIVRAEGADHDRL